MRCALALVAILLLACGDDAGSGPDAAAIADAAALDGPATDAGITWESVTPRSNDGQIIVEDLTYRSGALLIHAHQCRPADDSPHGVYVYNHGGFSGLQIDPELARCEAIARLGFVWLASSYRGEDGSEGEVEICLGEVDDVLAMLAIARVQAYIDGSRILMYGGSHGGCITERALQRGARVRAAADLFGPTDWATLYDFWVSQGSTNSSLIAELNHVIGGPPAEHAEAYALRSPAHFAPDFPADIPLFIAHGTADTIVPVAQSCALAAPLALPSWHVDDTGVETAAVPAGCPGVPSMTTARPNPSWPGPRYLVIYDGLGHEIASAAAQRMLQDVATFFFAK